MRARAPSVLATTLVVTLQGYQLLWLAPGLAAWTAHLGDVPETLGLQPPPPASQLITMGRFCWYQTLKQGDPYINYWTQLCSGPKYVGSDQVSSQLISFPGLTPSKAQPKYSPGSSRHTGAIGAQGWAATSKDDNKFCWFENTKIEPVVTLIFDSCPWLTLPPGTACGGLATGLEARTDFRMVLNLQQGS